MYDSKIYPDLGRNTGQMAKVLEEFERKTIKIPPSSTTHDTRNTWVPCRQCLGWDGKPTGIVMIIHSDKIPRIHHCTACKGKRVIHN